jgi:P4 family phage/plasmid primase-like protien
VETRPATTRAINPEDPRGLTAVIAEAITRTEHFAKDVGGKLYHYEKGVYRRGGDDYIAASVKELLDSSGASAKWTTHRTREVTEYIRVDAPVLWEHPPTNQINVLNGVLDLERGELLDHDPAFLSPVQLPVEYDEEAECPEWEKFVEATFPEDAHDLAWEIPALLMTPDTSIQKAVLLTGEGANGKSTYLAGVEEFIGPDNCVALSLQKIESDRFAASRLIGKLANICPDLPSDHLTSTSTFKAITGGDRITAEYKFRDSFEVLPFARLVFSANHPPRSGDASHAFYRRWLVVPFNRTFEPDEQIPRSVLDAKLSDPRELSGVLNKALRVLTTIRERGGLSEPGSVKEALAEFQRTTDPLTVWLERNTVEHPTAMVAQDELRHAYNAFCERTGKPGMSPQNFGRALARARPGLEKAQRTWRGVAKTRVYIGIGPRNDGPEDNPDRGGEYRTNSSESSTNGSQVTLDSRDSRENPNCFVSQSPPELQNNRESRVNRVNGIAGGNKASFDDQPEFEQAAPSGRRGSEGKGSGQSGETNLDEPSPSLAGAERPLHGTSGHPENDVRHNDAMPGADDDRIHFEGEVFDLAHEFFGGHEGRRGA